MTTTQIDLTTWTTEMLMAAAHTFKDVRDERGYLADLTDAERAFRNAIRAERTRRARTQEG